MKNPCDIKLYERFFFYDDSRFTINCVVFIHLNFLIISRSWRVSVFRFVYRSEINKTHLIIKLGVAVLISWYNKLIILRPVCSRFQQFIITLNDNIYIRGFFFFETTVLLICFPKTVSTSVLSKMSIIEYPSGTVSLICEIRSDKAIRMGETKTRVMPETEFRCARLYFIIHSITVFFLYKTLNRWHRLVFAIPFPSHPKNLHVETNPKFEYKNSVFEAINERWFYPKLV